MEGLRWRETTVVVGEDQRRRGFGRCWVAVEAESGLWLKVKAKRRSLSPVEVGWCAEGVWG